MIGENVDVIFKYRFPNSSKQELMANKQLLHLHFLTVAMYDNINRVKNVYDYGIDLSAKDAIEDNLGNAAFLQRTILFHQEKSSKEVLNFLIEKGVNINQGVSIDPHTKRPEYTPLSVASNFGLIEPVKFLLEKGADPDIKTCYNQNALSVMGSDTPEIAKLLITANTDYNANDLYLDRNLLDSFRYQKFDKTMKVINQALKFN